MGDGMEGQGRKRKGGRREGEMVRREWEGEGRKRERMWRVPESGLPRSPRWLSAGLSSLH